MYNYDWDNCFNIGNIDDIANAWTNSFLYIARECIPNKIVKIYPSDKLGNLQYGLKQSIIGIIIDN